MITRGTEHLTMNELHDALRAGEQTVIVYAKGELAFSRDATGELNGVANLAWSLHQNGKVALTQRRLGPHQYEYLATRRGMTMECSDATSKTKENASA